MERLAVKRERKRTMLLDDELQKIFSDDPEKSSSSCDYEFRKRKKKVLICETLVQIYSPDLNFLMNEQWYRKKDINGKWKRFRREMRDIGNIDGYKIPCFWN